MNPHDESINTPAITSTTGNLFICQTPSFDQHREPYWLKPPYLVNVHPSGEARHAQFRAMPHQAQDIAMARTSP